MLSILHYCIVFAFINNIFVLPVAREEFLKDPVCLQ